ncbi:hypothetical protein LFYK43_08370 [Ligilactobacillus salitolerans]|uniref:Uncharacterized protein n=1 Tax=Ligilactobacillus salitolerans TaxID=1808352 RepID=A0A401IS71_9LACO|nr:hypothetical protein LFYK43_08370 [Ligilactobacillus salitolerans]
METPYQVSDLLGRFFIVVDFYKFTLFYYQKEDVDDERKSSRYGLE